MEGRREKNEEGLDGGREKIEFLRMGETGEDVRVGKKEDR